MYKAGVLLYKREIMFATGTTFNLSAKRCLNSVLLNYRKKMWMDINVSFKACCLQ